jgi:hypothetical protein
METPDKIRELVMAMNAKGKKIATSVSGMPGLPYDSFGALRRNIDSKNAFLQPFSFEKDSDLFSILANSAEARQANFGLILAICLVISAFLGAIFISWMLLVLLPFAIIGMKLMKRAYSNAILRWAASDELTFCFLFEYGQVAVYDKAADKLYHRGTGRT